MIKEEDMDLLLLLGSIKVDGGYGGMAGKNGKGGSGGSGGLGGKRYIWKESKEEKTTD